jgi:hypothetical protein
MAPFPLIFVPEFTPALLQDTEYDNVETLINVRRVRWITEDVYFVFASIFKKFASIMQIVTIHK